MKYNGCTENSALTAMLLSKLVSAAKAETVTLLDQIQRAGIPAGIGRGQRAVQRVIDRRVGVGADSKVTLTVEKNVPPLGRMAGGASAGVPGRLLIQSVITCTALVSIRLRKSGIWMSWFSVLIAG